MRIVAGRFRGHSLAPAPKRGVRPTSDPLREALFSILGPAIAGRPFLDLAAGTGAVGLEAYSRGAEPVFLVERDRAALAVIRRNLERLRLGTGDPVRVVAADVGAWLARAPASEIGAPVGAAFLDPPYGEPKLARWIDALASSSLLDAASVVLVEHRTGDSVPTGDLEWLWTRRYGDSSLTAARLR